LIPFTSGSDIEVALGLTSVDPNIANALGGDVLTIVGSGFPLDKNLIHVSLESVIEGASVSTGCSITSLTETELKCVVQKMANADMNDRTLTVTVDNPRHVTRRRLQSTAGLTVSQVPNLPYITGIVDGKYNVCPVLK
jgi:hypothetical protein